MAFYSYIFSANYKRFFDNLKQVAKKEKKNFLGLVLDTGYCVFRYGFGLTDYLNHIRFKLTVGDRKSITGREGTL